MDQPSNDTIFNFSRSRLWIVRIYETVSRLTISTNRLFNIDGDISSFTCDVLLGHDGYTAFRAKLGILIKLPQTYDEIDVSQYVPYVL